MNNMQSNPSLRFFNTFENEILSVRNELFHQLEQMTPEFSVEVRNLFEYKLKNNDNKPPLGELFPWIIKDLINLDTQLTKNISVSWFAVYLYTLFLDEYVDYKKPIKSEMLLAGSVLAKIGFMNLSKIVKGTKYETIVDVALNESVLYQLRDVQKQKTNESIIEKEEYSLGKNKVILACAGALAASSSKHQEFIIKFTNSLLLSLQYLDDITDFEEDFYNENYTVLLHNMTDIKTKFLLTKASKSSYRILLSQLIINGSLERVTAKLNQLLSNSVILIEQLSEKRLESLNSYILFITLKHSINTLNNLLNHEAKIFQELPKHKQEIILDKVEQHIKYIAQST